MNRTGTQYNTRVYGVCAKAIAIFLMVMACCTLSFYDTTGPKILDVELAQMPDENGLISVETTMMKAHSGDLYVTLMKEGEVLKEITTDDETLNLDLGIGSYEITVQDEYGKTIDSDSFDIKDMILSVEIDQPDTIYLPLEGTADITASVNAYGEPDTTVTWTSSDPMIASVENGHITARSPGTVTVTASTSDGTSSSVEVISTDLFHLPYLESYKPVIPAYAYTEEEAHLLDNALAYTINAAGGEGTRGAVIAAARWLTMQLDYKIPYFFENGRLNPMNGRPYCDGEGRYYHKGMFLSTDKYDILDPDGIRWGPAIWGVNLLNWEEKYYFVPGNYYPNGLDCSGFVSWCLCQGGLIYGDIGAGNYVGYDQELYDKGEHHYLTVDLLRNGDIHVGDLIGDDGHIALIAGLDRENEMIYVAESLSQGVKISPYTYSRCVYCGIYSFVNKMDNEYIGEGVYTEMW